MGEGLHAPARVRDQREVGARVFVDVVRNGLEGFLRAIPGVGHERVGLRCRARFRGDQHERPKRVEIVERRRDVGGIRGIEDAQVQIALDGAERPAQDVGGEAAAAHAGDDRGREALVVDGVAEAFETGGPLGEVGGGIEPAETVGDRLRDPRIARPETGVAVEQAGCPVLGLGSLDRRRVGGRTVAKRETGSSDDSLGWIGHRGLRSVDHERERRVTTRRRIDAGPFAGPAVGLMVRRGRGRSPSIHDSATCRIRAVDAKILRDVTRDASTVAAGVVRAADVAPDVSRRLTERPTCSQGKQRAGMPLGACVGRPWLHST
jgi:hypothetical protein